MRDAAMIGVGGKTREHEVGEAERKIDSKQPQAVEQQQRHGDGRKAALAPLAGPPAPQRRQQHREQAEDIEQQRDPTERCRGDNRERERRKHALSMQIAVIIDRVRIGVIGPPKRRDQLQTGRNGRISRARRRLRLGGRNARRDRLCQPARIVLQQRRKEQAIVSAETRDRAARALGPGLSVGLPRAGGFQVRGDVPTVEEGRGERQHKEQGRRADRCEQRAQIKARGMGCDFARDQDKLG